VLDDYQGVASGLADWSLVDLTVHRSHFSSRDALVAALRDVEVVVVMRERTPFDAELFARLPSLRLLVTSGMRNASIDLDAAAAAGVTVCGTGSTSGPPVELTWALILGLARHLVVENLAFRSDGPWQSTLGTGLAGKTLGLLGFGKIGVQVGRVARAFGMSVVAWSANLTAERTDVEGVRLAGSLEDLVSSSDVLSVHLVLSERTRGLLGAEALKLLRPTAFLVNTSRAGIVDQKAMVEALVGGRFAGAGLDVFEEEPLPVGHVLRRLPNVLATPHVGYVTDGNYGVYFREAVEDIRAFLDGEPVRVISG